jgi:Mannose-1-phosphate guanylyltransferase
MLVPVILSGGSGTRLWPVSRASYPKQFVNLVDPDRSLLQMAAERINGLNIDHTGWLVVANNEHRV